MSIQSYGALVKQAEDAGYDVETTYIMDTYDLSHTVKIRVDRDIYHAVAVISGKQMNETDGEIMDKTLRDLILKVDRKMLGYDE